MYTVYAYKFMALANPVHVCKAVPMSQASKRCRGYRDMVTQSQVGLFSLQRGELFTGTAVSASKTPYNNHKRKQNAINNQTRK